jgi:hypothetical protein
MEIALERYLIEGKECNEYPIYNYMIEGTELIGTSTLKSKGPTSLTQESLKIIRFKSKETQLALKHLLLQAKISCSSFEYLYTFENRHPNKIALKIKDQKDIYDHENLTNQYIERQLGYFIPLEECSTVKYPDGFLQSNDNQQFTVEIKTFSGKRNDSAATLNKLDKYLRAKISECLVKFRACGIKVSNNNQDNLLCIIDIYTNSQNAISHIDIESLLKIHYINKNNHINLKIRVLDKELIHKLQDKNKNINFDQSVATLYQINCIL